MEQQLIRKKNHSGILFSLGILAGWNLLSCNPDAAGNAEKPNIILIMADDLGYGDVGFIGNKIIKTPHLDEMAENGVVFTRFYAGAAVCSPTRGSCLTGRNEQP